MTKPRPVAELPSAGRPEEGETRSAAAWRPEATAGEGEWGGGMLSSELLLANG